MSHDLKCRISDSIWTTLQEEVSRSGHSLSFAVEQALTSALGLEHHSLFQVSTSGALVKGVFQGCIQVGDLKIHGDFGLGTYESLDGELVMLGGHCYQASAAGVIREAEDSWLVPFATITRFNADKELNFTSVESFEHLEQMIDAERSSDNIFVGLRLDGVFDRIDLRAACKAMPGEDLVTATSHQSEFGFENVEGTLVGFWTPTYAKTLNVAGYHFHFISADRTRGGHLLNLKANHLSAALHFETDFHLAIPETEAFLRADLQEDPSKALEIAEKVTSSNR